MSIIVQKFGGTSVANGVCLKKAAARVAKAKERGHQVVVIVSAPAGMTDELIALARNIVPEPDPRELDMLLATGEQTSIAMMCMTLHAMGHPAISLTGGQVGIVTDSAHTMARIRRVETGTITSELNKGKIVVVAGFQGIDQDRNITTLGRGASDLTAVALAAALRAERCEIYTDVDGIYTADPRVVPNAARFDAISHDEILELAGVGAKVLHSRAVEAAKKFHVPLCVLPTFNKSHGTVVCGRVHGLENVPVCGVALSMHESRVTILGLPDELGVAAAVMGAIAKRGINMEVIVQSFPYKGKADMSFIVKDGDLGAMLDVCEKTGGELGAGGVSCDGEIARVSAVGKGMVTREGTAARMCEALGAHGINIKMITTSEINISVVVDSLDGERAVRIVHDAFALDKLPKAVPVPDVPTGLTLSESDTMEGLHIQAVEFDEDQAELKIHGIPDRPGQAALVLAALARAKVNLDVVLQNSCASGISVTMKRTDIARAKAAVESMAEAPAATEPVHASDDIAKVSVSGVGLKSHAGAASKVLDVLAHEGIEVEMIGTSEVKLTAVVSRADGARAAAALRRELKLAS